MWSPTVARQLRQRGFDALSVRDIPGFQSRPDEELFVYALAEGRAIVTENIADFRLLVAHELRNGRSHPGLVLTSPSVFRRDQAGAIGRLVLALEALLQSEVDLTGQEWWQQLAAR